jgi:cell wall-associated NlpC family hydrolase
MSRPRAGAAVVSLPVLDLRREPDHASELASQLLLGEAVDVLGRSAGGRWLRVRGRLDGYSGWARAWGLVLASRARVARWLALARHQVVAMHTEALTDARSGGVVSPLHWRSRVIRRALKAGRALVELPDGRLGWLPARAIAPLGARAPGILERIQSITGTPYLWGGRSAMALDCSGFTQLVMAEQGVSLPRDAREQWRSCRDIAVRDHARLGDLVFFGAAESGQAHVGIFLGDGYFVHARGRVGINSLDPDNLLCDSELVAQFRGIGRPPANWRPRSGKSA